MNIPFGKYRGIPIEQIPDDYLLWLSALTDIRQPLLGAVLREMGRRLTEADRQPAHMREHSHASR